MKAATAENDTGASVSRAEAAAEQISRRARELKPGARLGSRTDLKTLCNVSVGTLHEALRLLQSTGEITVRTGPGGGIFAGESSALSDLIRSVHVQNLTAPTYPQVARVLEALSPLLISDAIAAMNAENKHALLQRLRALENATHAQLRDVVRSSLEIFATIASIPPQSILKTIAGSILRLQLDTLRKISTPIDPEWRHDVDEHVEAVTRLVTAIVDSDLEVALTARARPAFMRLFETLSHLPGR